jgi:hypothetical protein
LGFGDGIAEGGDGEDAAAIGYDFMALLFGAGLEDLDVGERVGLVDAGDGQAGGVLTGVAFA